MSHDFQHLAKGQPNYVPQIDTQNDNSYQENSNQYQESNNSHNPYLNPQTQPALVQQGIVYQGVPNAVYAPSYPNNQNLPVPSGNLKVYTGGNYPIPGQNPLTAPETQAFFIETKILSGFCCYTCLLYTGLVFTIFGALIGILNLDKAFLSFILSLIYIWMYIYALNAKTSLSAKKQHNAFLMFFAMTALKLIFSLITIHQEMKEVEEEMPREFDHSNHSDRRSQSYGKQNQTQADPQALIEVIEDFMVFAVMIDLCLNLILILNAKKLAKMMKERELLLNLSTANRT